MSQIGYIFAKNICDLNGPNLQKMPVWGMLLGSAPMIYRADIKNWLILRGELILAAIPFVFRITQRACR
jgi:hypothetical protein